VDGCGCSVCGMCVAWVVVWAVLGTCSSAAWDEPLVGVLLSSQTLGANVGSRWSNAIERQ
jgi:hypothetical protein